MVISIVMLYVSLPEGKSHKSPSSAASSLRQVMMQGDGESLPQSMAEAKECLGDVGYLDVHST